MFTMVEALETNLVGHVIGMMNSRTLLWGAKIKTKELEEHFKGHHIDEPALGSQYRGKDLITTFALNHQSVIKVK